MRPFDTSAKVAALQHQLQQELGPEGRFALALELSHVAREFALSGLRQRRPELSEQELARELTWILYGDVLKRRKRDVTTS